MAILNMFSGGGGVRIPLEAPTNLTTKSLDKQAEIKWTDPVDKVANPGGEAVATWLYSVLVRKAGSEPTSPEDGTKIVRTTSRNQYQTAAFIDTGLTNGTKYYYKAFSYTTIGVPSLGSNSDYAEPRNAIPSYLGGSKTGTIAPIPGNNDAAYIDMVKGVNKCIVKLSDSATSREPLYAYDENLIQTTSASTVSMPHDGGAFRTLKDKGALVVGGGYGNGGDTDIIFISDNLVQTKLADYYRDLYNNISFSFNDKVVNLPDGTRNIDYYDQNMVLHQNVANTTVAFYIVGSNQYEGNACATSDRAIIAGSFSSNSYGTPSIPAVNVLSKDFVVSTTTISDEHFLNTNDAVSVGKCHIFIESYSCWTSSSGKNGSRSITAFDQNLIYSRFDSVNSDAGSMKKVATNLGEYYAFFGGGNEDYPYAAVIDDNLVQQKLPNMQFIQLNRGTVGGSVGKYVLVTDARLYGSTNVDSDVDVYVVE